MEQELNPSLDPVTKIDIKPEPKPESKKPVKKKTLSPEITESEEEAAIKYNYDPVKKAYDLELVKGRFEFTEISGKGAPLEFSYGTVYPDVSLFIYNVKKGNHLVDGETYELPRVVAQHLDLTGQYKVYENYVTSEGKPGTRVASIQRRYGFFPIGFNDGYSKEKTKQG